MTKNQLGSPRPLEIVDKKISNYTIHWLVIIFKLIPALIAFIWNIAVRKLVCPLVPATI